MGLSNAMRASQGQRPATSGTFGAWSPANVPEVAAGYFWLAASATGIGTVLFKDPEGGGHTTFDLIQAVVVNQPTVLTELGGTQFRMRKTGDAVGASRLASATTVTAGWTGPTYIGMWVRLPDASGDITNVGAFFAHSGSAGNRRTSLSAVITGGDRIAGVLCTDGTTSLITRWENSAVMAGAGWHYLEMVFDPLITLGGSTVKDRIKLFCDFALIARTTVEADMPSSLFDGLAFVLVGCLGVATSNTDTTDWAACYYANGIPSLANREALRRHLAPV